MIWYILIVSCLGLILLYFFRKNNNFFDLRSVFKMHDELIKKDLFSKIIFDIIPVVLGISCAFINRISENIIEAINISIPVYIGLQFSVIGILYGLSKKYEVNGAEHLDMAYEKINQETFNEIVYETFLSVFVLILSFIIAFVQDKIINIIMLVFSAIIYCLLFMIFMNTFIVLKTLSTT